MLIIKNNKTQIVLIVTNLLQNRCKIGYLSSLRGIMYTASFTVRDSGHSFAPTISWK